MLNSDDKKEEATYARGAAMGAVGALGVTTRLESSLAGGQTVELTPEETSVLKAAAEICSRRDKAQSERARTDWERRAFFELAYSIAIGIVIQGRGSASFKDALEEGKKHAAEMIAEWKETGRDPNDLSRLVR